MPIPEDIKNGFEKAKKIKEEALEVAERVILKAKAIQEECQSFIKKMTEYNNKVDPQSEKTEKKGKNAKIN